MQGPVISILIPFKNTAAYIAECLESIVQQSFSNWEVLAVNDHATDGSLRIVNDFMAKDKRIKCFSNKGSGIIEALRTAYANSKGLLITRMDSDDIMPPNKLQYMSAALLANGRGHIAIGQVQYFSESGISNGYQRYQDWLNKLTQGGVNYTEIYKECVIPSPCWMTYREDLDACGAFEPHRYPEDYDLAFRFYERGLKCIPCTELLHYWRDYDTRTSRTSEHYAQNYFLDIKLHYFLKLEYDIGRPLTVWGAGNKGKTIAKGLISKNIDFYWLCDNPNKIGKVIYDTEMMSYTVLKNLENPQSIVTVANDEAQAMIRNFFSGLQQTHAKDYFFFC
ncbi:glycosyltransferase family 2 protein [Aggregatimonas sangjinii]|uniref:Glycosyltransferase family 2 protein n=1 Tax=Aggregatimonas sangjinii TaxID=2583587 RepID=A0A5B7SNN1_9FLAO|nr:glycosyltransferase family 2 protein [Aggregatimonas sangjinii]QCX00127.1 glycosyltransferase family 2 protein [Aggregatimonas sangjinii]